jgi:hypothetical protein
MKVRLDQGDEVSLVEFLQVSFLRRDNGRDEFEISEGVYSGKRASVVQKSPTTSWLVPTPTYKPSAKLAFSKSMNLLNTPVENCADKSELSRIVNGEHPIQIADFPHKYGQIHLDQTKAALNWFYLRDGLAVPDQEDDYLHPGRISEGCITVTDVPKWTQPYEYLVLCCANAGKTV